MDWLNYVLEDLKISSFIGGVSISNGECCTDISDFYDYSTELTQNSMFVIALWILSLITGAVIRGIKFYWIENKVIKELLEYSNYFMVTVHLGFGFHVIFASVNALFRYSTENIFDFINMVLAIIVCILCLLIVVLTWSMTNIMRVR